MALSNEYVVPSDVRRDFYKWIYQEPEFKYWETGQYAWQLRCVGGPGSGKTTFSAIVADSLRGGQDSKQTLVAIVFVQGVPTVLEDFVRDFLWMIFVQLNRSNHVSTDRLSAHQQRPSSLAEVDAALEHLLKCIDHAFLIIDDVDACGYAASMELEKWLRILQKRGLRIMTTSRIGLFKLPYRNPCDLCPREDCRMWWTCARCNQMVDYIQVCYECIEKNISCSHCGSNDWYQPFDRVELNIGQNDDMLNFISYELQSHHGNMGLLPKVDRSEWPPPTRLARSLSGSTGESGGPSEDASRLPEEVHARAAGNLTLAKLQIEGVREVHDADEAFASKDRQPPNVVLYFNDLVKPILQDPMGKRILRAVASMEYDLDAASKERADCTGGEDSSSEDEQEEESVLDRLKALVQDLTTAPGKVSTMQLLFAVRGVLRLRPVIDKEMALEAYHGDFLRYLTEGYNEQLK